MMNTCAIHTGAVRPLHAARIVVLWLAIFGLMPLSRAQIDVPDGPLRERIQAMKIAFFTQKLALTSEEAAVFWPVYNAYTAEQEKLQAEERRLRIRIRQDFLNMDEQEMEQQADAYVDLRRREFDLFESYHQQFKKVLPIRKVILLYKTEDEFKQRILIELRERMQNRPRRDFRND